MKQEKPQIASFCSTQIRKVDKTKVGLIVSGKIEEDLSAGGGVDGSRRAEERGRE